MRLLLSLMLAGLSACGDPAAGNAVAAPSSAADSAGRLAAAGARLARAGCRSCHAAPPALARRLPESAAPPLTALGGRHTQASLATRLRGHHGLGDGEVADLAAWLLGREPAVALQPVEIDAGALSRGGALWDATGCRACHEADGIGGLAQRTDHAHVVAFLQAPAAVRPDLLHDFELSPGEATVLAAWLLREQRHGDDATPPRPGLQFECFEMDVGDASLPDLTDKEPAARGTVEVVDASKRTRDDQFVLRFTGYITVPQAGEYTFTLGSDDASWLWLDEALVVANTGTHPHKEVEGKVVLDAGAHAVRIVMLEKTGGQSLEWLWRGPGFDRQPVPGSVMGSSIIELRPPVATAGSTAADAARGAGLYAARGCAVCHGGDVEPASAARPTGPPIAALAGSTCRVAGDVASAMDDLRLVAAAPADPAAELLAAMTSDGCLSCHTRDGTGGLASAARATLVEVEDLGEEGRLPPDLTRVGHRLRGEWIQRVLTGDVRARPYLRVRMPRLSPDRAQDYARRLREVDAVAGDDAEPAFSPEAVAEGRRLVGNTGYNCITCHVVGGRPSLGPQGMDLAIQHERLRPGWFAEWLLHPTSLRPGTRMPAFWNSDDDAARREAAAVRVWASLGNAAPVPLGFPPPDGMVLDPMARPILHGAFLRDLSARCVAVGSPLRTHYAYDVEHARLAWLWRGAFVDAAGTWSGRAGKLLTPLGEDQVRFEGSGGLEFGDAERRVIGRRMDADGYPIWRLRIGAAVVEDLPRPRLAAGGSELVRTLRCVEGEVECAVVAAPADVQMTCDGQPAATRRLRQGESMEIVYRW